MCKIAKWPSPNQRDRKVETHKHKQSSDSSSSTHTRRRKFHSKKPKTPARHSSIHSFAGWHQMWDKQNVKQRPERKYLQFSRLHGNRNAHCDDASECKDRVATPVLGVTPPPSGRGPYLRGVIMSAGISSSSHGYDDECFLLPFLFLHRYVSVDENGDAGDVIRRCLDAPRGFRFVSDVPGKRARAWEVSSLGFLLDGWTFLRLVRLDDIQISVATRGLNVRMGISTPSDYGTTLDHFLSLKYVI